MNRFPKYAAAALPQEKIPADLYELEWEDDPNATALIAALFEADTAVTEVFAAFLVFCEVVCIAPLPPLELEVETLTTTDVPAGWV